MFETVVRWNGAEVAQSNSQPSLKMMFSHDLVLEMIVFQQRKL